MKVRPTVVAWVSAMLVLTTIESAHAASFGGTWSVLQVCETTNDGARGYTWRYDANVKNGRFVGQYRNKAQVPWMTLEARSSLMDRPL